MASVAVTPQALAELEALPGPIVARVERIFERLAGWPEISGAKPLRGDLAGHWRIRTGDYGVQFRILAGGASAAETVVVEKIGHRDRFYDD